MAAKSFVVYGLGKFGYSVAVSLAKNGCEVLAIDNNGDIVEDIANDVTLAVRGNVKDQDIYHSLGIGNMDGAVVAVSGDMEASILATILSKEAGIPYVLAKAESQTHAEVLKKIGADQVILPNGRWVPVWRGTWFLENLWIRSSFLPHTAWQSLRCPIPG